MHFSNLSHVGRGRTWEHSKLVGCRLNQSLCSADCRVFVYQIVPVRHSLYKVRGRTTTTAVARDQHEEVRGFSGGGGCCEADGGGGPLLPRLRPGDGERGRDYG
jgi:hypothetical protein